MCRSIRHCGQVHLIWEGIGRLQLALVRVRSRRLLSAVISVLVATGTAAVVLVATGGKPTGLASFLGAGRPPAAGGTSAPAGQVPGTTGGDAFAVSASHPGAAATGPTPVAPLRGLRQADLLIVAPFSLSRHFLAEVSGQPSVTEAVPIEAARVRVNGAYAAVLGVDPSTFRGYATRETAESNPLWQGVADGGVVVSYTMGRLDRLPLGGMVTVAGRSQERLRVVAFGTVGIDGIDAVVSDAVARSLGMPASNAVIVSAPPASVAALAARIKRFLPSGAAVEPLVTQVTVQSGGGTTVSSGAAAAAGYLNPLRSVSGMIPERVDQGVDFSGSGPVYALGAAVITNAIGGTTGWPGGGWITYQLTSGPDAGLTVYVAEDVRPTVRVGQYVSASTVIGDMFAGGDGIETGWAQPSGLSAESQLPEAGGITGLGPFPTRVGVNFDELLQSLGVPAAPNWTQPAYGLLPANYPANGS
jgi:murein DD-endopeptidase MepM/ murein hydrolase activator NlpD